jgi:hypothetical protein
MKFSFKILTLASLLAPPSVFAQEFVSLTTLPGITDFTNATNLVNGLITIVIVAAALLAVIQIIRGGFIYLTTEAVSSKGEARSIITDALTGLLLVLVSVLMLTIINPDILNVRFLGVGSKMGTNEVGDTESDGRQVKTGIPKNEACPQAETGFDFAGESNPTNAATKSCVYTKKASQPEGPTVIQNGVTETTVANIDEQGRLIIIRKNTENCPPTTVRFSEKTYTRGKDESVPGSPGEKKCVYRP